MPWIKISFENSFRLFIYCLSFIALPYVIIKQKTLLNMNSTIKEDQINDDSRIILNKALEWKLTFTKHLQSQKNINSSIHGQTNQSLISTLHKGNGSFYLRGNVTSLKFHSYGESVDLRIIVLAYNRSLSLKTCLNSLNMVKFDKAIVKLHIWIDREKNTGNIDDKTYKVAQKYVFFHGSKSIHIHPYHAGILNQWVNAWRPSKTSQEIAVFLEDDMSVSPFIWQWLKAAHRAYNGYQDISGYGLSHPGMEHVHATHLDIPSKYTVYLYKVICTWGFSPHPVSWRHFQEWFYQSELDTTFQPLVDGILPTEWFKGELSKGRERSLWEMWHIYYTHNSNPPQYTVMLNSAQEGLLAVNRHEVGTHDKGTARLQPLCETWKDAYVDFPRNPPKFGYDGKREKQ